MQGSQAGTAFTERRLVVEARPEGVRVWAPILEASDCTGAVALTLDGSPDETVLRLCEEIGMLAGCAISLAARYTDLYNLVRRRKAMSLPASLQWDLLPPMYLKAPEVSSVGVLEPAYHVGGDCFDHSLNGYDLDVVIMDAMGHGLQSSMASSLAMGTYRHDRREGQSLATIHERLDRVIAEEFASERFVTGQIARVGLHSGRLTWVNAGHPPPLLVRAGRLARALVCEPSLPWGLGGPMREQATEQLEPGDAVLFHTDGVTDGVSPAGETFGVSRLTDLVNRAAGTPQPAHQAVRDIMQEILSFQDHKLRDDVAMLWVTWRGPN